MYVCVCLCKHAMHMCVPVRACVCAHICAWDRALVEPGPYNGSAALPLGAHPAHTEPAKVPGRPVRTEPGQPGPGCQRGLTRALAQLSGRLDPPTPTSLPPQCCLPSCPRPQSAQQPLYCPFLPSVAHPWFSENFRYSASSCRCAWLSRVLWLTSARGCQP